MSVSDHRFFAVDGPVGSGKTEAAIRYMLSQRPVVRFFGEDPVGKVASNFLYVAPTVELLNSVRSRLEGLAARTFVDGVPPLVVRVSSK